MKTGLALSELDEALGEVSRVFREFHLIDCLELQFELPFDDRRGWAALIREVPAIQDLLRERAFLSVHSPTKGRDLSSLDEGVRSSSVREILEYIRFADEVLCADAFVLHPCNPEFMSGVGGEARLSRKEAFYRSFSEIAESMKGKRYGVKLCIENLEYPSFPSLPEEMREVMERCHEMAEGFDLNLVLDIPHLWHSLKIAGRSHPGEEEGVRVERGGRGLDFPARLQDTIEAFTEDILFFHSANCIGEKTHEPIFGFELRGGEETMNTLNLLPLLPRSPLILEIYGVPPDLLKKSRDAVDSLFGEGEWRSGNSNTNFS